MTFVSLKSCKFSRRQGRVDQQRGAEVSSRCLRTDQEGGPRCVRADQEGAQEVLAVPPPLPGSPWGFEEGSAC